MDFNEINAKKQASAARKAARAEKGLALGLRLPIQRFEDAPGREEKAAARKAAGARKKKRLARRKEIFAGKPGFDKRGNAWTVGKIKKRIVRLMGLSDKKKNGSNCRLNEYCPRFDAIGAHEGTLAYHLVPQNEGEAARLDPLNVVWACEAANGAERRRRAHYARIHIAIFGQEFMDERWRIAAQTIHDAKRADLVEMLARLESEVAE